MRWISRTFSYQNEDSLDRYVEEFLNSPKIADAVSVKTQFQVVFAGEGYQVPIFYVMNITAMIWEKGENHEMGH